MTSFEPTIVAFCCEYCAYAAADTAGTKRLSYPANVKIVNVPCSGRVDALHVLRAFEKGADGVYIAGCLDGDCHFEDGNTRATRRVEYIRHLLNESGIGGERLEMVKMSAGMGDRFAETAKEITEKIRKLGPSLTKRDGDQRK